MSNYKGKFALGKVFGRLTVVGLEVDKRIPCCCACGTEKSVSRFNLGRSTMSCGCLNSENTTTRNKTHGWSKTETYKTFAGMKARCNNPSEPSYVNYGGRGIVVCHEWQNSFEQFLADMGERPEGKTLERLDNDGPYNAVNCTWATPTEQSNNRRSNRYFTVDGVTDNLTGWAKRIGISASLLFARVGKLGMSIEKAIALGPAKYGRGKKVTV
jgi:hypothetical protein